MSEQDDRTAVAAALDGIGTPAYVYDLAEVRRNHQRLRAALPGGSTLYYSLKANTHPDVLRTLRLCGTRPEVCSTGELRAALDAGWEPGEVLYTGPAKRVDELRDALASGVRVFSVDSPAAIEQLGSVAGESGVQAHCILRVNDDRPVRGQGLVMSGVASQFGADVRWILGEPEAFSGAPHAEVIGLHLYMGSNVGQVDDLVAQFSHSLATARAIDDALSRHGVRLRLFDLGGGFGAPFASEGGAIDLSALEPPLADLFDKQLPGWREQAPVVAFESGRYLVGTAGTLFTAVVDAKESQGRNVVVLESGINHLGGMSGLRRLPPLVPALVALGSRVTEPLRETLVAGPLCTPLDTWARSALLPPLRPGDLLAVPNVGAYGLSASLVAFLGHPFPHEVVVDTDSPSRPATSSRLEIVRVPGSSAQHHSGPS